MVRDVQTLGKGSKEEETMIILFGEEIESLSPYRLDGSKEECQIFADIFYGRSLPDESNSCAVSRASDTHKDGAPGCCRKVHVNFNLENSNISSNSFMKGSSSEALELAKIVEYKDKIRSGFMLRSSGLNSRKNSSLPAGVLDEEIIKHCFSYSQKNHELEKPDFHGYQPFSFRIVESFAHGILSSYCSVNQLSSVDFASNNVNCASLNYKTSVQQLGDNKVILEANFVTSPVSQESIASGLVKGRSTIEVKDKSGFATSMDQIAFETLRRHPSGWSSKKVTNREMPDRLESYAHSLLTDAGWIIESRVRRERIKPAFFFRKPDEGLARSSLSSAWKTCGERLLYTASESEKDDHGREWSDVNEFWSDLKDVLAYIDMKTQQQVSKLSLLRRWQLLDPFLAVVFINRKISILRMGKLLRAVKSATYIPDCSEDICDVNMNENRKRKSKSLSSKCKLTENYSLDLNPTDSPINFGCDSPVSSDLESEDLCCCANKMLAGNELQQQPTSSPHKSSVYQQESRSCDDTDGFSLREKFVHGFSLCSSTEIPLNLERADAFSSKETSSVKIHNGLLKKAHKKSKKISEIKEAEFPGRKSKTRSKTKHREPSAHSSDESNSDLPDLPCYEASGVLISECLEPSQCLKRQTGNVLSTSEDESSHTSKIQEANSTLNIDNKKALKFENKAARKFSEDRNEIPLMPVEEKTAITLSGLNEGQDGIRLHKLMKIEHNTNMTSSDDHSAVISSYKWQSNLNEIQHKCSNWKESFVTSCDGNISKTSFVKDSREEVYSTTDGLCPGSEESHKANKACKSDDRKGSGLKRLRGFHVNDDDLLIAAIIKKKDFSVYCKKFPSKPEFPQPEALRKMKTQKRGCSLLPRAVGSGGKLSTDGKQFVMGTRTVLGWLIDMGVVSLKDVVQFRNPKNHVVIKDGWVTRDGILCKCCTKIFSVSGFKVHAGLSEEIPPLNLYLKSGKSYTLCQLQAWSAEYKLRKGRLKVMNIVEVDQNDDTCGICADGGELICCDNCPSTYHQSCLSAQELPEGSWYCENCICKICNNLACKKEDSSSLSVFECSQCGHKYHGTCFMDKFGHCEDAGSNTWLCGDNCKRVFLGLRSRVGMPNIIEDGLSWTILRCNHDDQNVYSTQKIALMAECNSKLAIALTLMEECFVPMVDPRTGIDIVPHVLYNWGVHGIKVAEMPFIATCGLQRRQGMCRRLMNAIETMLRSFKVEMIVLSAIPSLVETWMAGFGFNCIDAEEKKLLEDINLMLFPGTVLLKKKLYVASIETGGNDQFCSTQDESHILVGFDGKKHVEASQWPSEDGGLELDL
ncbi:hypothetical protein KFK09_007078 [Dendrobium nobile]|uniref:PHD-type domain-containing protein n=2 Tax=Dendrobium TaxID=37818 RepID=A0A8T3BW41_DENNO|nr:hypothetical protein KFK09_007078 [Dendrobium nobile]